jgi:hypothetical protein
MSSRNPGSQLGGGISYQTLGVCRTTYVIHSANVITQLFGCVFAVLICVSLSCPVCPAVLDVASELKDYLNSKITSDTG